MSVATNPRAAMPAFVPSASHINLFRAYETEPGLMRKLTAYDPQLVVYYDSAVARWGIARLSQRGLHFIALWQDDGGGYLPLDERLYRAVVSWDLRPARLDAARTADEEASRREAAQEAAIERQWRQFDDNMQHQTRSNKRSLTNALRRACNLP
jgi:hypothetical protein